MDRLFPPALLACIGEGRIPEACELELVAEKVWREGSRRRPGDRGLAVAIARVALVGQDTAPTVACVRRRARKPHFEGSPQ